MIIITTRTIPYSRNVQGTHLQKLNFVHTSKEKSKNPISTNQVYGLQQNKLQSEKLVYQIECKNKQRLQFMFDLLKLCIRQEPLQPTWQMIQRYWILSYSDPRILSNETGLQTSGAERNKARIAEKICRSKRTNNSHPRETLRIHENTNK